jgi:hypothetical protein
MKETTLSIDREHNDFIFFSPYGNTYFATAAVNPAPTNTIGNANIINCQKA